MKKEHPIRTLLGINQQDVAMLLGVSRGQWSMFEIGKRDLPLPAKQLLAEMLTFMQSLDVAAKPTNNTQLKTSQQHLELLIRENEYQQLLAMRKIVATTKRQEAKFRLLKLAEFLNTRDTNKQAAVGLPEAIVRKASMVIESSISEQLVEQQHRHEMLEIEKLLLESKLRKLRATIEFINDKAVCD